MMKDNREYRSMELRLDQTEEDSYIVEGYASTFDEYPIWKDENGNDIMEQIDPHAFDEADLNDVVFRIDHEGRVYARSSAGTVELRTDDHGLAIRADLSKTKLAREVYEDIKAGNYPQMSFAFVVGDEDYDKKEHKRMIKRIAKVFDVSPVSFPANPYTELGVATRDYFNGVIEMEKAERLEAERRERLKEKIKILMEV